MRDVYIAQVGMIPFGRHYDDDIKKLTARAVDACFADAPIAKSAVQAAWFSNSGWGMVPMKPELLPNVGQPCIRGQVALAPLGLDGIPITNVENACASGSTAFYAAYTSILAGMHDVVVAVGTEKMAVPKDAAKEVKSRELGGFIAGADVQIMLGLMEQIKAAADKKREAMEASGEIKKGEKKERSAFMDFYSLATRAHMEKYGTTAEQLAIIASKNHHHGSLNPFAQYRFKMTPEEVLNDRMVSFPLTRAMCAPTGDGSSAVVLVSEEYAKKLGPSAKLVKIRSSVLGSTKLDTSGPDRAAALAKEAYEKAGVGPDEVDFAEVHDATAFGELTQSENLGFCAEGEGGPYAASGATALGGAKPINPCGGLESKGHPIGATGLAMVAECFWQLRGEAGDRQVEGARIGMIENGGGFLGQGEAAIVMNILEGPSS